MISLDVMHYLVILAVIARLHAQSSGNGTTSIEEASVIFSSFGIPKTAFTASPTPGSIIVFIPTVHEQTITEQTTKLMPTTFTDVSVFSTTAVQIQTIVQTVISGTTILPVIHKPYLNEQNAAYKALSMNAHLLPYLLTILLALA